MSARTPLAFVLASAAAWTFLGACSSDKSGEETVAPSADEQSLVSPTSLFYSVRRDPRMCPSPTCGGYFLTELNRTTPERYVSRFELPFTLWDDETAGRVLDTPDGDLVVRGSLASDEVTTTTPYLVVWEAFRGLPGATPGTPDRFYQVAAREPPISCIVAPCNNQLASLLNGGTVLDFTSVSVARALRPQMDAPWLRDRVERHGAVVLGSWAKGQKFQGGYEELLMVSQVFIRLPDRPGPCVDPLPYVCPTPYVTGYVRDAERCFAFDGCIRREQCSIPIVRSCAAGFTRTTWPTDEGSCIAAVCEPSFVVE
jgi:hypothetical protein